MIGEPDLAGLRALALVAQEGSISAAAARLEVTQQAVSTRIRGLEKVLRVRLLVRTARGSHLTPSGELVVGWAGALLAAADEFTGAVETLDTARGMTMTVAASLTIAEHLLPEWLARWRVSLGDEGPLVQLTAANSSAVITAVREGHADLGFIETPAVPTDLGSTIVGFDSIELVAARNHRWTRGGMATAREVADTPLVLREAGSGTRLAFEEAMTDAGFPLHAAPAAVLSTTLGVRSAIMAGVAPGALSSLAVREDIRSGRLVRIRVRNLRIKRPLTAIWPGKSPSRSARALLEVIARAGPDVSVAQTPIQV